WQSQGTSYTPDLAIEQLQLNYIGASTVLTANPNKDLNALLGGSNPYTIVGLDPSNSLALFVSGWGLDGKGEAILYVTRLANGNPYWHSVLIAPGGFAPPVTLIGPYAVIRVQPEDVLNIRSAAGPSQPVVGSFPADAVNVMRTGPTATGEDGTWVEVQNPSGGTGWVNSAYLTEYVTHDAFCADTRIPALIEQLKGSMNQSNGDTFAALVDPVHGVDVHLWAYQRSVNFSTTTARAVFTSTESYNWGTGPSSKPDIGTFKDIIQPRMLDTLNASNMETYCDDLSRVFTLARPWPFSNNIHFYNFYKPSSSPAELDFRTWLIGFEYINNQPYLRGMVTIVWEP
ncbi:MAG: SH3 domain-containing protein, partial [Chloroflexi bacterium]